MKENKVVIKSQGTKWLYLFFSLFQLVNFNLFGQEYQYKNIIYIDSKNIFLDDETTAYYHYKVIAHNDTFDMYNTLKCGSFSYEKKKRNFFITYYFADTIIKNLQFSLNKNISTKYLNSWCSIRPYVDLTWPKLDSSYLCQYVKRETVYIENKRSRCYKFLLKNSSNIWEYVFIRKSDLVLIKTERYKSIPNTNRYFLLNEILIDE